MYAPVCIDKNVFAAVPSAEDMHGAPPWERSDLEGWQLLIVIILIGCYVIYQLRTLFRKGKDR
jgi:hypothetical protein